MTPAYIALGSNLDKPLHQLQSATAALDALPGSRLERLSGIYRSAAVGPGPQPDYLNAVVRLATGLAPRVLLEALQQIETDQERRRTERWGPRTLDLDLLLYGDWEIDTPQLTLPHPRMFERDFVLYPLHEISDTTLVLPGNRNLDTLVRQCPDSGLARTDYRLTRG